MVLRNSAFVFGAVVFTGHDTKQMRNIDVLKSVKRSRLDRQMNRYLFFIFGILICLILGSAVAGGFLRHNIGQVRQSVCLSVSQSACLSACLLVSVCLSACVCLPGTVFCACVRLCLRPVMAVRLSTLPDS